MARAGGTAALPDRPIVLTFDDGFADFHAIALPLLRQYGFTATLFVTTGWIALAGPSPTVSPGRMLTWDQVCAAVASGVEVAAHSHSQPQLDQLPDAQLDRELTISKALLEDRLGSPVPGVAHPFGYSSARVRRAVRAAGYRYACAVGNAIANPGRGLFALPRLTVKRSTRLWTFGPIAQGEHLPLIFAKSGLSPRAGRWSGVPEPR